LAGLMLLIVIMAGATRLMPHGTAAETVTPQQVYFHLQNDPSPDRPRFLRSANTSRMG